MNKKLVLSVLSTAVLTSMAASAMALEPGFYVGGNVDKYYSTTALSKNFKVAVKEVLKQPTVYVDKEGKAANFVEALFADDINTVLKPATPDMFEDDDYKIVGTDKVWNKKGEDWPPVPGTDLKVESVSAINSKSVKVTFGSAVEALTKDNVTVVNKTTGDKQYIKAVTLSEDKKSATVEFYESLAKGTYTATVKVGEKTGSKDFDFVKGEVAKIQVDTLQVVPANEPTAIAFKALDENGLDITEDVKAEIDFESTTNVNNGSVTLGDDVTAFVYVKYTKADGTVVKSERITVKGEHPKAVEILNWTLKDGAQDWTDKEYKQNTLVKLGGTALSFQLQFKDQFGKAKVKEELTDSTVQYESLDKTVALVDRSSGKVTALKAGTVPVKISVTKDGQVYFTKTVEITVGTEAAFSAITLDASEITVSSSLGTTKAVALKFKDQFQDDINVTGDVTATVKTGKDLITLDGTKNGDVYTKTVSGKSGETFNVTPVSGKEGTAVIELAVIDTTIKTTLTVHVEKAGAVENFTADGFKETLDKNGDSTDKTKLPESMKVLVYGVDANGGKAQQITSNVNFTVKDANGKVVEQDSNVTDGEVVIDSTKQKDATDLYTAGKTYTLSVTVGPDADKAYQVFTKTFTVTDTTETPKVELTKNKLEIKAADNKGLLQSVNDAKVFNITFTGVDTSNAVVTDFEFYTDNEDVISGTKASDAVLEGDGNVTLSIKSVTVDIDGDGSKYGNTPVKFTDLLNVTLTGFADKAELATLIADAKKAISELPDPSKIKADDVADESAGEVKKSDAEKAVTAAEEKVNAAKAKGAEVGEGDTFDIDTTDLKAVKEAIAAL